MNIVNVTRQEVLAAVLFSSHCKQCCSSNRFQKILRHLAPFVGLWLIVVKYLTCVKLAQTVFQFESKDVSKWQLPLPPLFFEQIDVFNVNFAADNAIYIIPIPE